MRRLLSAIVMSALPSLAAAQTVLPEYRNDSNPVVQRVVLSGRFHLDYAALHADQGDEHELNIRRLRIGPRVTLFRTFTVHGEVELDPQRHAPFYVRFTDLYVQWNTSAQLSLTV